MDKPTPSTSVRHNDDLSKALIESYMTWMDGDTFQGSSVQEEGIPSLEKKEDLDDGTKKDPKANAGRPDPVGGVKQSHGAEIRDTTKLVAREEAENVEEAKKGLYANIHAKRKRGESPAKPGSEDYPAKNAFKKAARTAKEEVSFELEGVTYTFEREVIEEGMKQARKNVGASTCWKGYKAKGTKTKDGKEVPNCVKEEEIQEKKLDPVNHKALKGDHADRKDKDIDNDGDVDKSDKYLHNRRKTVSKIIAAKKKSAKK